jgi:hypothetical protein
MYLKKTASSQKERYFGTLSKLITSSIKKINLKKRQKKDVKNINKNISHLLQYHER